MIKVENIENALKNMKAKGYREKHGNFETFVSVSGKSKNLGTYKTEKEARDAILKFRMERFSANVQKEGDNPCDGVVYKNTYVAFPSGNIYNLHGSKMVGAIDRCGYHEVIINGKLELAHRIIAKLFLDNPENKEQVNHKNGIKTDNRIENLEWCTRSENLIHAYATGLEKRQFGENHHSHKLTESAVKYIKKTYKKRDKKYGAVPLAKLFGVDRTTIHGIIREKSWKGVV